MPAVFDDQFNLINSYLQKQLLTIGWVLLTYNELMAMQADYIGETYSGAEYDVLMENYKAAELDLDKTGETLLEEAADLMDRQLTFSPIEPVKLRLIQLMKPEDNLVVNLQNRSYHSTFPMTAVMEEDSLESNVKAYFEESGQYVKNPDNPAVKTTKAADFELVGVTTGAGTAFYYILQQIFQLQDLEYKFNFKSGALYSPDVHTPSCDWYNLRDWQFDFDSGNTAADVQAVFGQARPWRSTGIRPDTPWESIPPNQVPVWLSKSGIQGIGEEQESAVRALYQRQSIRIGMQWANPCNGMVKGHCALFQGKRESFPQWSGI